MHTGTSIGCAKIAHLMDVPVCIIQEEYLALEAPWMILENREEEARLLHYYKNRAILALP